MFMLLSKENRILRRIMELLLMVCGLALAMLVQGLNPPGFISIDCGIAEGSDYEAEETTLRYTSDGQYVDTGTNHNISSDFMSGILPRELSTLRNFPQGIKNCYTINPPQAKGNKYLIRTIFMYGNYDSKNQLPEFALYLEGDRWDTVTFDDASDVVTKEIIHVPVTDYIHLCLVNSGSGTPFISALELRLLNNSNSIYNTESGSLDLFRRLDVGSITNETVRYNDDVYDRIWEPDSFPYWQPFSANYSSGSLSSNDYKPPRLVMMTAVRPVDGSSLEFYWNTDDSSQKFYFYMYFAEVEKLQENQLRKFDIFLNGDQLYQGIVPVYQEPTTTYRTYSVSGVAGLNFSINATNDSTHPPILNALEIYMVKEFLQSPTNQSDVDAIRIIKSDYGVKRNWQGDPCVPRNYSWDDLECNYDSNSPKIISLNLSSSSLSGHIAISFYSLKSLQDLDLSNNNLTGPVPEFLSQLPFLKTLNLSGNNLTGSVPSVLIERSKSGSLALRTEGNQYLCQEASCVRKKRKKDVVLPVIVSIASCIVLLTVILAMLWSLKRKKQLVLGQQIVEPNIESEMVEEKNRQFTYSEVISITNNFQKELGKGGVGIVYAGKLNDGTQVAVKMLSQPSTEGSKQFRTEARLLTKVHHRNLACIIGYCNEGQHMGLIYEYMAKGNLKEHLSEKNDTILSWAQRLQIAFDAAQALEYLHSGCKPPIIHRDIKTANILLTEKLEAKVSDFGISRFMPHNDCTQVTSTAVAGTPGYLDPEYQVSNRLNEKSDVYSFGVVLLELITGKPPIVKTNEVIHIVEWVKPMLERAKIKEIVDSRLNGDFDTNCVWKIVETAMACVQRNSIQRPVMSQVVAELRECMKNEEYIFASSNPVFADSESSFGGPSTR